MRIDPPTRTTGNFVRNKCFGGLFLLLLRLLKLLAAFFAVFWATFFTALILFVLALLSGGLFLVLLRLLHVLKLLAAFFAVLLAFWATFFIHFHGLVGLFCQVAVGCLFLLLRRQSSSRSS